MKKKLTSSFHFTETDVKPVSAFLSMLFIIKTIVYDIYFSPIFPRPEWSIIYLNLRRRQVVTHRADLRTNEGARIIVYDLESFQSHDGVLIKRCD